MRWKTPIPEPAIDVGAVRYRKKFVILPQECDDGYTYFLTRIYVKEQYDCWTEPAESVIMGSYTVYGWKIRNYLGHSLSEVQLDDK